ncbi:DUF448 domain-containing protein [Parvularcula lutaonensis]|uniref:DUF448 domain-containing protein n=1 Tax=Parvularcula lutaonensis TaxID=491923 RepID=A0ABV7MC97_9PROT|nr:DUF448 domain-containing protein [Parvularcula lutaonensis]GGY46290.1 hypothetical protein GCM10007148_14250 [Parvularcula lutaonensis]
MTDPSENKPSFVKNRCNDRRCVGTGEALAPDAPALRFARAPDGKIVLDLKGNLPGRGAWLSPTRDALRKAVKKGGFARALKAPVEVPGGDAEAYAEQVESALAAAALNRLGLCRKAGVLAIGYDNAKAAAKKGVAYLTPAGSSETETAKLANTLHKAAGIPHLPLPADRLTVGEALGQDAVHILLLGGGPSKAALGSVILWRQFAG